MSWFVHVNKNTIASNRKHGEAKPAIRFQKGRHGKPVYATRVRLKEAEFIYAPHGDPLLPCGARLVLATEHEPEVVA